MTREQARHRRLVESGLCLDCEGPWTGPPLRCAACSKARSAYAKARRAQRNADRAAQGLEVKPKGWNGFQARRDAILKRTPEQAQRAGRIGGPVSGKRRHKQTRARAIQHAREAMAEVRRELQDERIAQAASADVLLRFYEKAYQLGYWKGWRTGVAKAKASDAA